MKITPIQPCLIAISSLYQNGEITEQERGKLCGLLKSARVTGQWDEVRSALAARRKTSRCKVVIDQAIDATRA